MCNCKNIFNVDAINIIYEIMKLLNILIYLYNKHCTYYDTAITINYNLFCILVQSMNQPKKTWNENQIICTTAALIKKHNI